jgi:hypothetical protein
VWVICFPVAALAPPRKLRRASPRGSAARGQQVSGVSAWARRLPALMLASRTCGQSTITGQEAGGQSRRGDPLQAWASLLRAPGCVANYVHDGGTSVNPETGL